MITRRRILAGAAGFAACGTRIVRAAVPELALFGPPAGPSAVLAYAVESGALRSFAERVTFKVWRTPDEMRAGLTSGRMGAVVVPTYAAANMYNRGLGVRLVNVMTNGMLYVTATDPAISDIGSLRGRRLALPFKNDMPDSILRRIAKARGLNVDKDIDVQYTATPIEAVQMLVTGRADAALTPEPAASAAIMRGMLAGVAVRRAIDVQKEWASISGGARIPQAGLAVSKEFAETFDVVALMDALASARDFVVNNPGSAAQLASAYLDLPAPVIETSIPYCNLIATKASSKKTELLGFFRQLTEDQPKMIGGKLPDDGFFAI